MLHMVELRPDLKALLRYLASQGQNLKDGDDLGYGVHAWMAAAFGDLTPKPWRLFVDNRRPPRILGYSSHDATALRQVLKEFADPGVFAVTADPDLMIASRAMPIFNADRRLGFELLASPVGRKASTGAEKDLFLIRADESNGQALRRDVVYKDWAREWLEREGACTVTGIEMSGFRLVRMTRQTQDKSNRRVRRHLIRPQALLQGELIVQDQEAFKILLSRGVGRHRAFGYGMLLLKPVS
jgi:CRISPR system Cascade subunit CasE